MERKRFPELGEIDGIDDNFEDGEAENPDENGAHVKLTRDSDYGDYSTTNSNGEVEHH